MSLLSNSDLLEHLNTWVECQHVALTKEYRGTTEWSVSGLDFEGKTLCESIRINPDTMWCRMRMNMGGGKMRTLIARCKTYQIDMESTDET